jgi:hypothetical protein
MKLWCALVTNVESPELVAEAEREAVGEVTER